MWSYLYILLSVAALFGLKYYLLNYAYDRRKNIFCEPDFLAAESIKKYKKQKKVGALIKFRDINYVENIWKYSFDGIQEVVAQYKKLNKAADREFANYVGIHSLNMAVYLHMYLALQDPENRDKIRVNLKERMEPVISILTSLDDEGCMDN